MAIRFDNSAANGLVVAAAVIAGIGVIDAIRQSEAALAVLFAAVVALCVARLLRRPSPSVRVRPDHGAWLRRTAAVTGEPVDVVADRAIGAYRDVLDAPG